MRLLWVASHALNYVGEHSESAALAVDVVPITYSDIGKGDALGIRARCRSTQVAEKNRHCARLSNVVAWLVTHNG